MKVAVIGGTGKLGRALATRWARAGLEVIIGSRSAAAARAAAQEIGLGASGAANEEAAREGGLVVVTVPFAAHEATLLDIRAHVIGKIVIDTTVPLNPPKVMRVQLPKEGCAALRAASILGEGVIVVSAFHNVAAHKLALNQDVDCDVLVFGDDKEARTRVVELVSRAGLRGLHGGALANSAAAEAFTSVLIFLNKTYAVDGAGIRITGPLRPPAT